MRKAVRVESKRKAILLERSAGRLAISATPRLIVNAASYSCFSVETFLVNNNFASFVMF